MKAEYIISSIILSVVIIGALFLVFSDNKKMEFASLGLSNYPKYKEIQKPAGFVNSEPFKLSDYVGKKVILLDFVTYSCINCQRTFPYLNAWYEKYKDEGLLIVGIHTPEFAFEHKIENVKKAIDEFGIKFPLVLDNDYATWNAYGNRYWPRKYLIDIDGNILYDHIGEGAYEETENKIRELLKQKMEREGNSGEISDGGIVSPPEKTVAAAGQSPETYFGSARNKYLGNGKAGGSGEMDFSEPEKINKNTLYLAGNWNMFDEYAENLNAPARIIYKYNAGKVFLVMSADIETSVEVILDGQIISQEMAGADVKDGTVRVKDARLYELVSDDIGEHILELKIKEKGLRAYAFTFGA